jgi:CopA family copper-resistance protein
MSRAMRTLKLSLVALCAVVSPVLSTVSADAASYQLTVEKTLVRVSGRQVEKLAINGQIPGPTLHLKEGEDAVIAVTNKTNESSSVHWHGIMLPGMMDGAPGFNGFMGIPPGKSFTYTFPIRQSGTYWYHSHTGTQDQSVLGAIVIDPAEPSPVTADRDYVVLFGDITRENSDRVLRNLKADSGYYNYNKRTLFDFFRDSKDQGFDAAMKDRAMWAQMRMDPTDLADVTGYFFLVNGKAPDQNETFLFRKGERVRLRLINGSAMTFFDIRIPGLKLTIVAADGNDVEPVTVDELRMGIAERYDAIVEPADERAYTLFAESLDRAGYARATLATAMGQTAAIPERRPRTLLTMADMGGVPAGMDHAGHDMTATAAAPVDHSAHLAMDRAGDEAVAVPPEHAGHLAMPSKPQARPLGWNAGFPAGVKVISYNDLKARKPNADTREPTREVRVRLTGNMQRYLWLLNDRRFSEAPPIRVRYGERVRLVFANETMMAHPMHLHGMFFEVENGQSDHKPLKDTVIVAPGQTVSVVLTAKEVGAWPLHCHLLYHMVSGMMTTFIVEPSGTSDNLITPNGGTVDVAPDARAAHGRH